MKLFLLGLLIVISAQVGFSSTPQILYSGIALFDEECSGFLFRFDSSLPTDKALLLTNAHCMRFTQNDVKNMPPHLRTFAAKFGLLNYGTFLSNFDLDPEGLSAIIFKNYLTNQTLRTTASKLVYFSRSRTDIAILQLSETYALLSDSGISATTLSPSRPYQGEGIAIVSGQFDKEFNCSIEAIVPRITADMSLFTDALRYSDDCKVYPGTSGSPVISKTTGQIVGINSLRNHPSGKCTAENVFEYDLKGKKSYSAHVSGYATATHFIYSCLNKKREIDLSVPGCQLFGGNEFFKN